jgi:DHA2 family multidrug resistance protein-like MFS transporter
MNFNTGLVLLVIGLGWASFSIWSFYYWSFILDLRLYSPTIGGATYVPFMIFGITASLVVSVVIRRCQSSYILLGSAGAFLFGITMLSVTPVHQSYFKMSLPQMIVLSFGMDMSFPAASLILSDNLRRKHQGMASSLVSTTTNYAMSIGLGIAGTAEGQIFAKTGDTLRSYRSAMYVGIGFSGLGVVFAILLHLIQNSRRSKNEDDYEEEEEDDDEPSPKVGKHHLKE